MKDQVTTDWTHDAQRHTQEAAAAKLLTAVKGGQSLADAAAVAGVTVRAHAAGHARRRGRGHAAAACTAAVRAEAGRADDGGDGDGFIVAVPAEIVEADPKADPSRLRRRCARRCALGRQDIASVSLTHCASAPSRASISPSLDNVTGQQQ